VSERTALNDWLGAPVGEEPARGSLATGPQH
jgi:hypothetical protein